MLLPVARYLNPKNQGPYPILVGMPEVNFWSEFPHCCPCQREELHYPDLFFMVFLSEDSKQASHMPLLNPLTDFMKAS